MAKNNNEVDLQKQIDDLTTKQQEYDAVKDQLYAQIQDLTTEKQVIYSKLKQVIKAVHEAIETSFVDGNAKWPHVKDIIESRAGKVDE